MSIDRKARATKYTLLELGKAAKMPDGVNADDNQLIIWASPYSGYHETAGFAIDHIELHAADRVDKRKKGKPATDDFEGGELRADADKIARELLADDNFDKTCNESAEARDEGIAAAEMDFDNEPPQREDEDEEAAGTRTRDAVIRKDKRKADCEKGHVDFVALTTSIHDEMLAQAGRHRVAASEGMAATKAKKLSGCRKGKG